MKRKEAQALLDILEQRLPIVRRKKKNFRELMAGYRASKADQIPADRLDNDYSYIQFRQLAWEEQMLTAEIKLLQRLLDK